MTIQQQLLTGRFQFDILPNALVRAIAQIDGRIAIEFITPAGSQITIDKEQAVLLVNTLNFALKEISR